ncbi:MAG: hypothetical protein NT062_24260 [Proteobacteria bacterium]|nr:hypothetical protein [Pseudomonadota bacterium]
MNLKSSAFALALLVTVPGGCKKSGGGGGGGGWLVGREGLMANVDAHGAIVGDDPLGSSETLNGIACRFEGEAFVVGAHGTLLYTDDGGQAWSALAVPTRGDLRAHDALQRSADGGATWRELSDGKTAFRSIAAAQRGETVLAVAADGGLYAFDGVALVRRATIAGARAVGVSPDGQRVIVAGDGVAISRDAGRTFQPVGVAGTFNAARIDDRGEAIAAGDAGVVVNVSAGGVALVQHVGTADLFTVHMKTWGDAAAAGNGYLAGEDGQVYLTTDAGWSWHAGPNVGHAVLGADEIGAGHN